MAWTKMSTVPNPLLDPNGDPASGFVLKCYLPGTTTTTPIATDNTGGTTVSTMTSNAEGKWEVSGNEYIPHIDRSVKWGIFANATDATANTPFYQGPYDNVVQSSSGGSADLTYTPEGTGAVATNVQSYLRQFAKNPLNYSVVGDGTTDDTSSLNTFFDNHSIAIITEGTYLGQFTIHTGAVIVMEGNPTFKLPNSAGTDQSTLTIESGVTILGSFTVDGNVSNNAGGSSAATTGALSLQGSSGDIAIHGDVFINNAHEAAFEVWNGSNLNSGTGLDRVEINGDIIVTNAAGHTGYIWQCGSFTCNTIKQITGAASGSVSDSRVRTGTQSSSTLKAQVIRIQNVIDCPIVCETRSEDVYVGFNNASGTKVDNAQNVRFGELRVESASVSNGNNVFGIGCEFATPVTSDIKIERLILDDCNMSASSTKVVSIAGTAAVPKNIHIDTVVITNSGDSSAADFAVRDVTNLRIDTMVLDNDGGAARGLLVESGYTRSNFSIGRLESTGHATSDIEDPEGECEIQSFNNVTATRSGNVYMRQPRSFSEDITVTIGSGANFETLKAGFQYASEMRPTYNPTNNDQPTLTLQIQSGYSLTDNITLDGGDYSHVRVTVASGTITCNTTSTIFNVTNGCQGPKITGTYDKNNKIGIFALVTDGATLNMNGIVISELADEPLFVSRAKVTAQNANMTKNAGATASACAAYCSGGEINADGATFPYATVANGGQIRIDGGTATGGTSETVNTFTANGSIYT